MPSLLQFVVPCGLGWWFIQRRKQIELLLRRGTMFATRVQGERSMTEMGRAVLDFLAPEIGAPIAALYAVEADGSARRCGGYAFEVSEAPEK